MNPAGRQEPIHFTRGRRMHQITRNCVDDEGYLAICDGRVVVRGVDRAKIARVLIIQDRGVANVSSDEPGIPSWLTSMATGPNMLDMRNDYVEEFIEGLRLEQERLKVELAPFLAREMYVGLRQIGGIWRDITDERIQQIKNEIASIEKTIEVVIAQREARYASEDTK